jgi:AcrR family transcriptional regulator
MSRLDMVQKARSKRTSTSLRREESLSREQIIEASIELLDSRGEDGLTFRTLSERLATGPGAIYWHIANKSDLLTAACDAIIARTVSAPLASVTPGATPQAAIRLLALDIFDAIDAHPWVGSVLTRAPGQSPMVRIVERIGQQIRALGVPKKEHWVTVSALLNYILGVGGRNAANGQFARTQGLDRSDFLEAVSTAWSQLDPEEYPFARSLAGQLNSHDDRKDFVAGIDMILRGIGSPRRR